MIFRPSNRRQLPPILIALVAMALLATSQLAIPAAGAATREVHFDGHSVEVPRSWPVYRLAQHPGMCVRLDRPAVYLGSPSANQRCPAGDAVGGRRAILVDPGAPAPGGAASSSSAPRASASAGGSVFTGLGFDACSAPSSKAMSAWASSPYRAIGVYIGGTNRACAQPNLTASWVSAQVAAGWHLIPTYVGLQAPTSSCSSCAKLTGAQASAQGTAAAVDAVNQAAAVAMGPGSPIYFDMESYSRTAGATAATLAFLEAWTKKLHALGYVSGVYSSGASGVADLVAEIGSDYAEPDDLWIADWNGQANSSSSYVPASAWAGHQRIHQYQGGHNETYGGQTINIDNDYVDGATVGTGTLSASDDPVGYLDLTGAKPGYVRVRGWAFDPNSPTTPLGIRVSVGGRTGTAGALEYELGPIASRSRADVAAKYPEAGAEHGFDAAFPTLKSGPQSVCVYALGIAPGEDSLLGCKATVVPAAITVSHLRATARWVQLRLTCEWPTGTECPGQLALRTRFRVAQRRAHGRPPRLHVVTRSLGRRNFRLTGARSHAFRIPLSAGGRLLLQQRGKLRTQLIAAIPGGRRTYVLKLGG